VHRRQLLILYTFLSVIAGLLAWRLVSEWHRADLRYGSLPRPKAQTPAFLPTNVPLRTAPPVTEIVAKNLFSADRNNLAPQDEKKQPPPPLPVVFGTINLGGSFEALMAERGGAARPGFRRVKKGEQLGGYTIVAIRDDKVEIEFQGQKTTLDVYQSANSVPRTEARSAPPPPAESGGSTAPQPPPSATAAPPSATANPSSAAPGPASPGTRVTVEGNRRRMERMTPFGPQVWYEEMPK